MVSVEFRLRISLYALLSVIAVGTIVFMIIERLSLTDAFYFTIVTVTTVGYGDLHPVTQGGKIAAIILIVAGVGSFLGLVANATETLLNKREKRVMIEKLNMVIGVFFGEVGIKLLTYFSSFDPQLDKIRKELIVTDRWSEKEFLKVSKRLRNYDYKVDIKKIDLEELRNFLLEKRNFLLRLLENPNLLEHESFTDLLWAIFHLTEEFSYRTDLGRLPDSDYEHIEKDINRAYILTVDQWIYYMRHLKNNYPHLFSLAVRTNPFDQNASPIIK